MYSSALATGHNHPSNVMACLQVESRCLTQPQVHVTQLKVRVGINATDVKEQLLMPTELRVNTVSP